MFANVWRSGDSDTYGYCEATTMALEMPASRSGTTEVLPSVVWWLEVLRCNTVPLSCQKESIKFGLKRFWQCEIISGVTGWRHSAISLVASSVFKKGKFLKNGINRECFHVCFKSLLQDYVDARQVLHKPLSTSTGMSHKCCNSSTVHPKLTLKSAFQPYWYLIWTGIVLRNPNKWDFLSRY